jgi:hypothetical protein
VRVFTLVFRLVLDEEIPPSPQGSDPTLDLVDNWGTPLANGLYYLAVEPKGGKRSIGKLLILR